MSTQNGDVKLMKYTMHHGEENTAFDSIEDVAIKVSHKDKVC